MENRFNSPTTVAASHPHTIQTTTLPNTSPQNNRRPLSNLSPNTLHAHAQSAGATSPQLQEAYSTAAPRTTNNLKIPSNISQSLNHLKKQEQLAEPEKQLRTALEWISEAFERKAILAQQEVAHWKQVATQQRQQMLSLETEIGQLSRRIADHEQTISQFQKERKQLASAKNALNEKYNFLRKNALQLEAFRKQIVSMVEFSPHGLAIPDGEASFVDLGTTMPTGGAEGHAAPRQSSMEMLQAFNVDHLDSFTADTVVRQADMPMTSQDGLSAGFVNNQDAFLTGDGKDVQDTWASHLTQKQQQAKAQSPPKSPRRRVLKSRKAPPKSADTSVVHPGDMSVDAPTLYKQIREVLTPEEFDQFATCIANFNAGSLSARETIQSMSGLIKVNSLVQQMKGLISKAIAESSQDSIAVNTTSAEQTVAAENV